MNRWTLLYWLDRAGEVAGQLEAGIESNVAKGTVGKLHYFATAGGSTVEISEDDAKVLIASKGLVLARP